MPSPYPGYTCATNEKHLYQLLNNKIHARVTATIFSQQTHGTILSLFLQRYYTEAESRASKALINAVCHGLSRLLVGQDALEKAFNNGARDNVLRLNRGGQVADGKLTEKGRVILFEGAPHPIFR